MQYPMAPTPTNTTATSRERICPDISSIQGNSLPPLRTTTTCATTTVYSAGTCGHTNLVTHGNPLNTLARYTPIYYSPPGLTVTPTSDDEFVDNLTTAARSEVDHLFGHRGRHSPLNPDGGVRSYPGTTSPQIPHPTVSLPVQTPQGPRIHFRSPERAHLSATYLIQAYQT